MGWRNTRFVSSLWITFCATGLLSASAASSDGSFRPQDYFVSPDQADMPDLANRWWQWVYSNPDLANPRRDLSGARCSAPQSGDVWFLADAETSDLVERKCQLPSGKDVVFPVISNIMWTPPGVEQSCEEVKEAIAFDRSPNYAISVSLNGTPFPNPGSHLVGSSECFDLLARIPKENNPPRYYPSATDGYWFMLRALPVGTYDLSIMGEYLKAGGGRTTFINLRYLIEVVPQ